MTAPRASLVVITYGQERMVSATVASALAQDHPNLQIVLSDDHSPDGTFETLQSAVATYSGPHEVIVRQPDRNLGLVKHLYDAASLADGELIVVGAGDDLFYPHRVSRLVRAWEESEADALCSGWDVIDEDGVVVERGCQGGRSDLRFSHYFPNRHFTQIIGAAAAYTPAVFRNIPLPATDVFAEDLYLSLMLHWRGRRVAEVSEPLIAYRQHGNAMTHTGVERTGVLAEEIAIAHESQRIARLLEAITEVTRRAPADDGWGAIAGIDRSSLREDAAFNRFRSEWLTVGPRDRLAALETFCDPSHRRWLLPRLFGLGPLTVIKRLRSVTRSALNLSQERDQHGDILQLGA